MGRKSPIRRIQVLESTAESDREYAPSTNRPSSYRWATPMKFSEVNPIRSQQQSVHQTAEEIPDRDPVIRLLLQRVQKMEDDRTRSQEPDWGRLRPGPFTERIRRSRQDRDVQPLRITPYTGVEDPLTHLHSFQSAVGCRGLSDEGLCLLFPSSLTEAALNWFYHLEPGTVDSFDELKQIFLNHFMIQTDRLYSADDLYTIRQRDDEPLREYTAQFSHEYSRCPDTDDKAAYGAFKSGLRSSYFRYLVHSSNWRTYDELMKQGQSTPRPNTLTRGPRPRLGRANPYSGPPRHRHRRSRQQCKPPDTLKATSAKMPGAPKRGIPRKTRAGTARTTTEPHYRHITRGQRCSPCSIPPTKRY
ncbi:uncharacterized protein LOC110760788 [Prunus avium]|uniref:Uncharacterized protein LOC110760788 n=1 Tax=Prunus avium TaxID=42229 RepID=A0A6P5SXG4_PRUAV|nr:uncharacterized protein LOC110760788 [Prunus avium]